MKKIKELAKNKWVRFGVQSTFFITIFGLWCGNALAVLAVIPIYLFHIKGMFRFNWHKRLKDKFKAYNFVMGWVEAIVFALIVATFIRTYFVEMYVIPSQSMEGTLLVGDYIAVSKFTYGPKLANTPVALPLVHNVNPFNPKQKSYSECIKQPYKRLAGYKEIEHNDVLVFNYPQGDTVLVESPQDNYYALKRRYSKAELEQISDIMVHPVDRRDNYIKRVIGLPGDNIKIVNSVVYINGKQEEDIAKRQHIYSFQTNPNTINRQLLQKLGISEENITQYTTNLFEAHTTSEQAKKLGAANGVQNYRQVIHQGVDIDVFPYDTLNYKFNQHNLELNIPKRGDVVELTPQNISMYNRIITAYEGNTLEMRPNGDIYINGNLTKNYEIKMDYYFAMGDNRDNSLDSRFFGFIPEDHVVGKASFIWMSIDANESFPDRIRFSRVGNFIN